MKKSQISTVVNVETEARLRQQAKEQGISLSELIRRTLEAKPKDETPFSLGVFNRQEAQKRSNSLDMGIVAAVGKDSARIIAALQDCTDQYHDIQHTLGEMDERLQHAIYYMRTVCQVILRKETLAAIEKSFNEQYYANE